MNWLQTLMPASLLPNIDHKVILSETDVTLDGEENNGKQVALLPSLQSGSEWYNVSLDSSTSSTPSTVYRVNPSLPPQSANVSSITPQPNNETKGDTNITYKSKAIKVKSIITQVLMIALLLVIISTFVSLRSL